MNHEQRLAFLADLQTVMRRHKVHSLAVTFERTIDGYNKQGDGLFELRPLDFRADSKIEDAAKAITEYSI